MHVWSSSAEPGCMTPGFDSIFRIVAFKTEILLMTGQAFHTVCLSPESVPPILKKKGVASRGLRHVTVRAKGLVRMAIITITFELMHCNAPMFFQPELIVILRLFVLPPYSMTCFTGSWCSLSGVAGKTVLHGWKHDAFVFPASIHAHMACLTVSVRFQVHPVLECAVFKRG